ncbi:hypothetical protein B0H14DRAFT_2803561 [Mycena olivaceomarginata]|nr:hypothetical protein B0H14DRAFT_2892480 [Mycena olivaceomarginata]KAJ7810862.1 hypothetical protein B0H14DRAFT_2861928 [Mycena olivaceomarginata]KAJ7832162.1 hypothetical protein B0H14DRAFT_2803561 [Mycena olivaceomarginata]
MSCRIPTSVPMSSASSALSGGVLLPVFQSPPGSPDVLPQLPDNQLRIPPPCNLLSQCPYHSEHCRDLRYLGPYFLQIFRHRCPPHSRTCLPGIHSERRVILLFPSVQLLSFEERLLLLLWIFLEKDRSLDPIPQGFPRLCLALLPHCLRFLLQRWSS